MIKCDRSKFITRSKLTIGNKLVGGRKLDTENEIIDERWKMVCYIKGR